MRPLPLMHRSLAPCDRSAQLKSPRRPVRARVRGAVSASSTLVLGPPPGRTLTDSQQGHVDEKVPYGGNHIFAHLPLHLLGVQLRCKALDTEHRGSAFPALGGCDLLFSEAALRTELGSTPLPIPAPHFCARRRQPPRDNLRPDPAVLKRAT